jgi:hypothetical protein
MGYRFQDKQYNVLINGSTGEVQGQAPLSWIKILIISIVLLILIGGGIALAVIFGGDGNTQPANNTVVESSKLPDPYYLPLDVRRNGNDESWQLQFRFSGENETAKRQNWEEFESQNLKSRVESAAERVVETNPLASNSTLASRIQAELDRQFKKADGKPRFTDVRISKNTGTTRRQR